MAGASVTSARATASVTQRAGAWVTARWFALIASPPIVVASPVVNWPGGKRSLARSVTDTAPEARRPRARACACGAGPGRHDNRIGARRSAWGPAWERRGGAAVAPDGSLLYVTTFGSGGCLAPTMGCHAGEPDEP